MSGALRLLRRSIDSAAVFLAVVLAVALASMAYAASHAVLTRPLPFPSADQLVVIQAVWPWDATPSSFVRASYAQRWKASGILAGVAATREAQGYRLETPDGGIAVRVLSVSPELFDVLGVKPRHGRAFSQANSAASGECEAVVSDRAFRRWFFADPAVVGQRIELAALRTQGSVCRIAGILPPGVDLQFPDDFDFYVPLNLARDASPFLPVRIQARLRPGMLIGEARARLQAIADEADSVAAVERTRIVVTGLHDYALGWTRPYLRVLNLIAGLVILVASVNGGTAALALIQSRRREMAIRLALGASRARIMMQLLGEAVIVGTAAGATGLAVAAWCLREVSALLRGRIPRVDAATIDPGVIGVAVGVSAVIVLLAALWPAVHILGLEGLQVARQRRGADGWGTIPLQVALLFVVVAAATLGGQSLWNVTHAPHGFDPASVVAFELFVPRRTSESSGPFASETVRRVKELPSVVSAAIGSRAPFGPFTVLPVTVASEPHPRNGRVEFVDHEYLPLLRIPLLQGRHFMARDADDVAIVNDAFASTRLRGADPLGQSVHLLDRSYRVVGVAENVSEVIPEPGPPRVTLHHTGVVPTVYVPLGPTLGNAVLLVRSDHGSAVPLVPPVRRTLQSVWPAVALGRVETLDERLREATIEVRSFAWLTITLGCLSVLLCLLGVYAATARRTVSRVGEMAVRKALGASNAQIRRLVVWQALKVVGMGAPMGLLLAWMSRTSLSAYLFELDPLDLSAVVIATVVLLVTTILGAIVPANRCARIEAADVLKFEDFRIR
ncbi:MAG: ABC transporter permease [Vicinamibacterales bacterium]|nr:ABC transporter permease [Vicinamibacterales bacterium]